MEREACIYRIRCDISGNSYIGSTIRLAARRREHFTKLRSGAHHCIALQRAWTKHGESAFVFEVIERCDATDRMAREQAWIDREGAYNSAPKVIGTLGMKWSDEARRNASVAQRKRFEDRAQRDHLSRLNKGSTHSAEAREKIAAAQRGRVRAPETGRRISATKKGVPVSLEQREAISRTMKAKSQGVFPGERRSGPMSDDTRAKMSAAAKGRPKSESHRANMKAAWQVRRATSAATT